MGLASVIHEGGYIFVSVPYKYPYHRDPINTMFRPTIRELAALFPGTEIYKGEIINCGSYMDKILRNPSLLINRLRRPVGFLLRIPWLFKNFQVTCVILHKNVAII